MPRAICLDLSTKTGWALMERGFAPRFGTWSLPDEPIGVYARRYSALHMWLADMRQVHGYDAIGFEAPIYGIKTDTAHMARLLIGLAVVVETFAGLHKLPCIEVAVPTVKKALTGDAYADKSAMKLAAVRRGWDIADDHQADAGAVGLVVTQTLWPKQRAAT